jgi:hypothetical protein
MVDECNQLAAGLPKDMDIRMPEHISIVGDGADPGRQRQ